MESRNGFIVSIFNYCDRWCETCAFTGRCRLFAGVARADARRDPDLAAVIHAPVLRQELPPPPLKWMSDVFQEMNEAAGKPLTDEELEVFEPAIPKEHERMCARATDYAVRAHRWLHERGERAGDDPRDPVSVIAWFSTMTASNIRRALTGLAEFDGDRQFPPDHEGSAKVALLGLERSAAAWAELLTAGRVDTTRARRELDELDWLRTQLDAAIPKARSFVRPGFDETVGVQDEGP